jgi:hypothetical protein
MFEHVVEAERSYLVRLGGKHRREPDLDAGPAWTTLRDAVVDTLRARSRNETVPSPSAARNPWAPRYFVRRAAWHVLDHAWEIEDRLL